MSVRTGPLRRSRRLASTIPASYWRHLGYTYSESRAMEEIQADLKTPYQSRSTDNMTILDSPRDYINEEGERAWHLVEHNDLMLPHWEAFAGALKRKTERDLGISIRAVQLPLAVLETIMPSMQNMRSIYLHECCLGSVGLHYLCSYLHENSGLTFIGISGEEKFDFDAGCLFSSALTNHPTLKELCLENCNLEHADILKKILDGCNGMKRLWFHANKIGSASTAAIADYIGENHGQTDISLTRNQISDADVPNLVHSLRKNDAMTFLDLNKNQLTHDGRQGMTKALLDMTNVTSIVQSNHSCFLGFAFTERTSFFVDQLEVLSINMAELSKENKIRKKVLFALYRRPDMSSSLLHYCDDFPLGLVPHLLELIQQQYNHTVTVVDAIESQTAAFTRLFLALKRWRMPLLFENMHPPSKLAYRVNRKRRRNCFR